MELTHLVHALTERARRAPLAAFFVGGALLFGGKRLLEPEATEARALTVTVAPGASAAEVARATDDAILLAFAVRAGFVEADPAVRERLVDNVRFVSPELSRAQALARAVALDMHHTDAVARRRLIWLAEQTLAKATRVEPTDAALDAYLAAHPARFMRPPTFTFEQIFVSRERHGVAFDARVAEVGSHLSGGGELSDPSLLPAKMVAATSARIEARFGAALAEHVVSSSGQDWSGPIVSAFGVHFVRVTERAPGALPRLDEVRARVRFELETDSEDERVRAALSRMRAAYRIRTAYRVRAEESS